MSDARVKQVENPTEPAASLEPRAPGATGSAAADAALVARGAPASSAVVSPSEVTRTDPDWLTDHPIYRDAKSFLVTAYEFTFRTRRFVERWVQGDGAWLNPLTMVALSTALMAFIRKVLPIGPASVDTSVLRSFLVAVLPYAHYAFLGGVTHLLLFRCAAKKRARSTVAMMLYAASGPLTISYFLIGLALRLMAWRGHGTVGSVELQIEDTFRSPWHALAVILILAALVAFFAALGRSLAVLHQARWWAVTLALFLAFILSGVVYALLGLPKVDVIFQPVSFEVRRG